MLARISEAESDARARQPVRVAEQVAERHPVGPELRRKAYVRGELGERPVEIDLAARIHRGEGEAEEALGRGGDVIDGVGRRGAARGRVGAAEAARIDNAVAARDYHGQRGQIGEVGRHPGQEAVEIGGEAARVDRGRRRGPARRLGGGGGGRQRKARRRREKGRGFRMACPLKCPR